MHPTSALDHGKSAMTLLEMTVVILVLFSLVSILFIGARAWKAGSDRAACIVQIRTVQQGVRSYASTKNITPGTTVNGLSALIIGTGKFVEKNPVCPGGGTYTFTTANVIPTIGALYMACSLSASDGHEPDNIADW